MVEDGPTDSRRRRRAAWLATVLVGALAGVGAAADGPFADLPRGIHLTRTIEVPATQRAAIGARFGGELERITNSWLVVHGRTIQVNVIEAVDEGSAAATYDALLRIKPYPFCVRNGTDVIEYVGADVDEALAFKTSWELGFLPKPTRVRYRVTAELAPLIHGDAAACNALFGKFIELPERKTDATLQREITELARSMRFGRLSLRTPGLAGADESYAFEPRSVVPETDGAVTHYTFKDFLPARLGVPYILATLEIEADATASTPAPEVPDATFTAATPRWPADDPDLVALAARVTEGRDSADEKVAALLEWLAPGRNLDYSGTTGSRWGVEQVLEQGFGHCWDFSDVFVTLARASGVPARQVGGWLYGVSGHVWAEYHREGEGWTQVDPTGAGEVDCGIYHLAYFTSHDGEMPILYLALPKIEILATDTGAEDGGDVAPSARVAADDATPTPGEAPREFGRELTQYFYTGADAALWTRFTAEMRRLLIGPEQMPVFRAQVADQLGAEVEVLDERVVPVEDQFVYRRRARFDRFEAPVLVVFSFDAEGNVGGFSIAPEPREAPTEYLDYETRTKLRLPFDGEWTVFWGGRTLDVNYHVAYPDQRFAYDLLVMEDGSSHTGEGAFNEDYHCFDLAVVAPGAGEVVATANDVHDNVPGRMNAREPLGNHVILDHGNGEFSILAHFREGTVRVEPGDVVEAGELLGRCGNSGNSSEPHVHYHLQTTPTPFAGAGLPAQFRAYEADGTFVARGEPVRLQRIRHVGETRDGGPSDDGSDGDDQH